jgi:hypothetical protein
MRQLCFALLFAVVIGGVFVATQDKAMFKAFEIGKVELTQPGHYRVILKVRQMPTEGADFLLKDLKDAIMNS